MPRRLLNVVVCFSIAALSALPARAQEDPLAGFTDAAAELARLVPNVPEDDRADLLIGRAFAGMEACPVSEDDLEVVTFIVPGADGWSDLEAWAAAGPQQDAIEALLTATDRRERRAFALPYGEDAPADLRRAGFWVELEGGKTYTPAFHYLDALGPLRALVWTEANRLAEAGEGRDAAALLVAQVRFGRMICDRPYLEESATGYVLMLDALEQLRDVVYRNPSMLNEKDAKYIIRTLEERTLTIDRLRFPLAGKIAARQAVIDACERMGEIRPDAFSEVASAIGAAELDSSAHEAYYASADTIDDLFANWALRWSLGPFDIVMLRPSAYSRLDPAAAGLSMIAAGAGDMVFELRHYVRAALAGTRVGIGAVGHSAKTGDWPKPLVAIRPSFIRDIDIDPYDPKQADQVRYFVPVRDQDWGPRDTPHPHAVRVHYGSAAMAVKEFVNIVQGMRMTDEQATASVASHVSAIAARQIEPGNLDEKMSGFSRPDLEALVPPVLADAVSDLGDESLRTFARSIVLTSFAAPEYPVLKNSLADTDDRNRRSNRSRDRGKAGSDELRDADAGDARSLTLTHWRVGTPLAARLLRDEQGGGEVLAFTVELDAEDFILFSVGPDGVSDLARQVGLDGTDLMYWPPVLTLAREHTGG